MRQYDTVQQFYAARALEALRRRGPELRRAFWDAKMPQPKPDVSAMQAEWYRRYCEARDALDH